MHKHWKPKRRPCGDWIVEAPPERTWWPLSLYVLGVYPTLAAAIAAIAKTQE